jgi:hypothetical protein
MFPPTTAGQARALATTGNLSDINLFRTSSNGSASCLDNGYFVVIPSSLSDQQAAADLLALYFKEVGNVSGQSCGGLSIDAYHSQSEASSNSPTAGEATAGNVQLIIGSNYQVSVAIGSAISPDVQFSFSYA